jgi:putative ABC transport system permease protein
MIKNYLKITYRNIKRHKGYSFINISGLTVGITCCVLILFWVQDELSFDRYHENINDIYRVIFEKHIADKVTLEARGPNALGPVLKAEYPEIVNFTRFRDGGSWLVRYGEKAFLNDVMCFADPQIFEIFTLPFLKGDPKTALLDPNSIVLTEKMASKYFWAEDPMGKVISLSRSRELTVTGIIENIPGNSHFYFDYVINIIQRGEPSLDSWERDFRFYTYVQLDKNAFFEDINKKIAGTVKKYYSDSPTDRIFLQPLKKIHLFSNFKQDESKRGSILYVYIFSIIAFCILLIACINFMNLSTARAGYRAKEIGMRKVVGADKKDIIRQFLSESMLLSFISLGGALCLTSFILPAFNRFSGKSFSNGEIFNVPTIFSLLAMACITGFLAGSYPAFFLSSFHVVNILKGIGRKGKRTKASLRKALIVVQFSLTTVLLTGTIIVYFQMDFIKTKNLGFEKEHIISFFNLFRDYDRFKNEALKNTNVLNVSSGMIPGFDVIPLLSVDWEGKNPNHDVNLYPVDVDYEYLETLQMAMKEGRYFSRDFSTDVSNHILNETAVKALGIEEPVLGKQLKWKSRYRDETREGVIIGVVKDFHQNSLHEEIKPIVLKLENFSYSVMIKLKADNISETLKFLENKWKEAELAVPGYPFTYQFLDEALDDVYKSEKNIREILRNSALLAVFISCLGLLGLASFMAEQRTKEIGIRKVLGAPVARIVFMLNRDFTKWILLACLIACPIAYFLMAGWLKNFAYRIDLGPGYFLLATASALAIAFFSVSFQTIKAAHANPVESLRHE